MLRKVSSIMFHNRFNVFKMVVLNLFCFKICAIGSVEFKLDPVILSKFELETIYSITPTEWIEFTKRGSESHKHEKSLEKNLVASDIVVKNGTISHVQLLDNLPSNEAQKNSKLAKEILKSSLYIYNAKCVSQGISGEHCAAILSDIKLPESSELTHKCQNIVNHRSNGFYPLRRLLPSNYQDGFYKMFSNVLPEPFNISRTLGRTPFNDNKFLDGSQRNLAVVQWSQFVANDLSKPVVTTMSDGSPIECCDTQNYNLLPRHRHPACKPLVSKDFINRYGPDTCLNYVRSALAVSRNCTFGAAEQLNHGTAKLDLSQLYGLDEQSQNRMRLHQKGLLKFTGSRSLKDSLLPLAAENTHWFCSLNSGDGPNSTCFMAGDSRVNSNPFAIIIHTIMMRNHNRIAKDLNLQHTDWHDDDQIFQKAKSINIDIYKRIVFNEWLPVILGASMANDIMRKKKKKIIKDHANDESFYQISNEYAVAASRFYLSMMPNELHNYAVHIGTKSHTNESLNKVNTSIFVLKDEIYSPNIEYSSEKLDQILFSLLVQQAMKLDASYVESLTSDLANNKRPKNSDFMAFDIQRGRDHGLQPYFKYLEICNQIKINDWKDLERFIMTEDLNNLKTAYYSWHNIDLIVGGVSEIPVKNAILGPTFQCIFGEQFLKLRQWDQSDIDPADEDYLKWKFVTAADLLCINSNLQYVPSNIFKIPSETNLMVNCSDRLQKLNLNGNY